MMMSHEFKGEEKKQFDSVVAYLNEKIAAKFPGVKLELQDVVDGRDGEDFSAGFTFKTPHRHAAMAKAEQELAPRLAALKQATGDHDITVWSYPINKEHDKISGAAYDKLQDAHQEAIQFCRSIRDELLKIVTEGGFVGPDRYLMPDTRYVGTTGGSSFIENPYGEASLNMDNKTLEVAARKVAELRKHKPGAEADNAEAAGVGAKVVITRT